MMKKTPVNELTNNELGIKMLGLMKKENMYISMKHQALVARGGGPSVRMFDFFNYEAMVPIATDAGISSIAKPCDFGIGASEWISNDIDGNFETCNRNRLRSWAECWVRIKEGE